MLVYDPDTCVRVVKFHITQSGWGPQLSHDELGPSPRTVGGILHTLKHRATTFDSQVKSRCVCNVFQPGDVMSPVLDLPLGSGSHTPVSSRMRSLTSRTPFRKYFIKFMHMSTTNMKLPAYENYFASLALSLKRGMNTLLYKRMSKTTRYVRVTLVVLCPLVLRVRQSMSG